MLGRKDISSIMEDRTLDHTWGVSHAASVRRQCDVDQHAVFAVRYARSGMPSLDQKVNRAAGVTISSPLKADRPEIRTYKAVLPVLVVTSCGLLKPVFCRRLKLEKYVH
jgi:hypothetical protein